MQIISYNVNGIRAAIKKDLAQFITSQNADIICFQETKAHEVDIDKEYFTNLGYYNYWFCAQKKGYSSVGIISKKPLQNIMFGNNMTQADIEGRTICAEINKDTLLVNTYFPSGTSGQERQYYKMNFLKEYLEWLIKINKKYNKLIIVGDYNIAHNPIDIHDPISNKKSSGFLPEERAWMDKLLASNFIDSFRYKNPTVAHAYSWWTLRANARANNKGWRIDYACVSKSLETNIKDAFILANVVHSDHCPIGISLNL